MAQALYRKYRPLNFADVVNQEHVVTTLQNEIKSKKFAHAYLFSGPRGIGKTTIARLFARAINADAIAQYKLEGSTLMDIVEIDAASHTGVDNVRENVIQNAYVAPTQLDYKVFIIDEVHMLSVSAFNALLKILEEPPQHVVFVLATTEIHKVPATVISRCQRFDFHTIGLTDLVKRLQFICQAEKIDVAKSVLERIARRSGGAVRDAESMLGQVMSIDSNKITDEQADLVLPRTNIGLVITMFEQLLRKQAQQYLGSIHQAMQDGMHLRELHATLMKVLRQGMLYSVDQQLEHFAALDVHVDVHQQLMDLMKLASTEDCLRLIDLFTKAGNQLPTSRIQQLPLEMAGIAWCQNINSQLPTEIITPSGVVPKLGKPASTLDSKSDNKPKNKKTIPVKSVKNSQASVAVIPAMSSNTELTARIKKSWPNIVTHTREKNHSLAMLLTVAHVVAVTAPNTLQLGVRFDFHKARLCEIENAQIIRDVIMDVVGEPVIIECEVDIKYDVDVNVLKTVPSDNIETVSDEEVENVWDLALNTFEGEEVRK